MSHAHGKGIIGGSVVERTDTDAQHGAEENGKGEEAVVGASEGLFLHSVTSQTPWWIVSVLLHALVIVLASLISVAVDLSDKHRVVNVSEIRFEPPKKIEMVVPPPERNPEEGLVRTTTTDPNANSKEKPERGLVIDEALIPQAEVANRLETDNPERVDTGGAYGIPESDVFFDRSGHTGQVGGGGSSGGAEILAELIGVSGQSGAGQGHTWGDKHDSGIGIGVGRGFASRGHPDDAGRRVRIVGQVGGKPAIPSIKVCNLALKWLADNQEADGHWDTRKFGAAHKNDTAITSLALLAFLGAGHSEKIGVHKANVQRAVAWLSSKQSADGCIWDTSDDGARHRKIGYPHAIATLAMAEAAGMTGLKIPATKAAAQKAVDYCVNIHQSGSDEYDRGGWRYDAKSAGDLSVTGWYIMALKSAKVAQLHVPVQTFAGAIKFLDSVEVKDGDAAYGPVSHYKYTPGEEHSRSAHRLTAIGTLARQFLGWKREELQGSVEWFVNKGGVPSGEAVDLYYWYYGSMAVFQQGPKSDIWKRWNTGMLQTLLPSQCQQGADMGSWNPAGEYSSEWGRVGQTALSALCLEVYYRYDWIK